MTELIPEMQRRGVVAVVVRAGQLLVVRRSRWVVAPGAFCFPGGGIEPGESETDALQREMQEELSAEIQPLRRLWQSVTPWGVSLSWWLADLPEDAQLIPSPREVESVLWCSLRRMRRLTQLLPSNHHFLDALERGEFTLEGLGDDA